MGNFVKSVLFTAAAILIGQGLLGTAITIALIGKSLVVATGLQLLARLLFGTPEVGTGKADTKRTKQVPTSPARWILGRARVGGYLVWYREVQAAKKDKDSKGAKGRNVRVHFVLVVAEGACDAIEEIYINEIRLKFEAKATSDGGRRLISTGAWNGDSDVRDQYAIQDQWLKEGYPPRVVIWEYFKADGTQGKSIRDLYSASGLMIPEGTDDHARADKLGSSGDKFEWTTDHKLNGMSYVHVRLNQPGKNEPDVFRGVPEINFVVRGLKLKDPTIANDTAKWTDNAALCRAWWLINRRGVDPAMIDKPSFVAARELCDEKIDINIDDYVGLHSRVPEQLRHILQRGVRGAKFTINGVVNSNDDPKSVEDHMDVAWQGNVIEAHGKFYFKPFGADSTNPVRSFEKNEIVNVGPIQIAPAFKDRVNALRWGLSQSEHNDWNQEGLPTLRDPNAYVEDSMINLESNVGDLVFVQNFTRAWLLLGIQMEKARISQSWQYTVFPYTGSNQTDPLDLIPTDSVTIDDRFNGLGNRDRLSIRKITVNDDFSVTLDLLPYINPAAKRVLYPIVASGNVQQASLTRQSPQDIGRDVYLLPRTSRVDDREIPPDFWITTRQVEDKGGLDWKLLYFVHWNHAGHANVDLELVDGYRAGIKYSETSLGQAQWAWPEWKEGPPKKLAFKKVVRAYIDKFGARSWEDPAMDTVVISDWQHSSLILRSHSVMRDTYPFRSDDDFDPTIHDSDWLIHWRLRGWVKKSVDSFYYIGTFRNPYVYCRMRWNYGGGEVSKWSNWLFRANRIDYDDDADRLDILDTNKRPTYANDGVISSSHGGQFMCGLDNTHGHLTCNYDDNLLKLYPSLNKCA